MNTLFQRCSFFIMFLLVFVVSATADIKSKHQGFFLEFFESTTGETVGVVAPFQLFEGFASQSIDNATIDFNFVNRENNGIGNGSFLISTATGGIAQIILDVTDNYESELSSRLILSPQNFAVVEARIKLVTTVGAFNFGFNDDQDEDDGYLAIQFSTTILSSSSTNFAGFFADSDATTNNIRAVAVNADTDGTVVDSLTAIDTNWHIYQIRIEDTGDVSFWLDGDLIGSQTTGIATNAPLGVYLGWIRRDGAAGSVTLDVDYIRAWQKR